MESSDFISQSCDYRLNWTPLLIVLCITESQYLVCLSRLCLKVFVEKITKETFPLTTFR